jgi:hypothetical protein
MDIIIDSRHYYHHCSNEETKASRALDLRTFNDITSNGFAASKPRTWRLVSDSPIMVVSHYDAVVHKAAAFINTSIKSINWALFMWYKSWYVLEKRKQYKTILIHSHEWFTSQRRIHRQTFFCLVKSH